LSRMESRKCGLQRIGIERDKPRRRVELTTEGEQNERNSKEAGGRTSRDPVGGTRRKEGVDRKTRHKRNGITESFTGKLKGRLKSRAPKAVSYVKSGCGKIQWLRTPRDSPFE